jgi:hypothetical protein
MPVVVVTYKSADRSHDIFFHNSYLGLRATAYPTNYAAIKAIGA